MLFNYLITYCSSAFISGILLVLCYPTVDLFLMRGWRSFRSSFLSMTKTPKEAFKTGMVLGIPYFFGTLYWIYHSINHYGGISLIASIAIVILLCLYLSLYTGIFAFCSQ